jgi:leucyl-tRNA synthetase
MMNYRDIENKWQAEWAKARIFEGDIGTKPPYMVTAAFPYANAPQHIGHLRAFGTADVLARYKRMRGFNVLYPMAFHATGTPILAFAKRLQNKDKDLIHELKLFHVPDEEIAKMIEPVYIAEYFIKEIENGMHAVGYSIDWRRSFISIEPKFSKFVEWQIGLLNAKGLLTRGEHPVGWCPNENNAVGMHDTKHDVEPDIEKELAVKFKVDGEDAYMLCATYRPETIHGATNLFVNDGAEYITCRIGKDADTYYVSKAAAAVLGYQFAIETIGGVDGKSMLSKHCLNPLTGAMMQVLPGFFVKESVGTGIVMSVPAHAPFDYVALERLRGSGYAVEETTPKIVIATEVGKSIGKNGDEGKAGDGLPALRYLKLLGAGVDSNDDLIEQATKLEYKEESHWGTMTVQGFEGMKEPEARERIKAQLVENNEALEIHILANSPVYCRCGTEVVVKVVDNQWFINYGNKEWKQKVNDAFKDIVILPEKSRKAFESAINWIDLRAVARAQGLGTRFPIDRNYIIESLSDSTLYMSFYTIINFIRDVEPDRLKPEFFDFVLLGKGDAETVATSTGMNYDVIRKCQESFRYWYTNTSRHSGPDLIFNHLTMYMYNHVALLDREYWPKQIVVNGSVLSEGEKMSKSLGNIVPLSDAVEKHGADPLRFVIVAGADLFSDSEYSDDAVNGVKERFEYVYGIVAKLGEMQSGKLEHIDYWLYSKLNRKIETATKAMDMLELRVASTEVLYNSVLELKRYFSRGGSNAVVVKDYVTGVVLMLTPIAPHISEELWKMLDGIGFASLEKWPVADESMVSNKVEKQEDMVDRVIGDVREVVGMIRKKTGKEPREIRLIIAEDWKRDVNNLMAREKNVGKLLEGIKSDRQGLLGDGAKGVDTKLILDYVQGQAKRISSVQRVDVTQEEELSFLNSAADYMYGAIGCKVVAIKESESKSERAARSIPGKPSVDAAV